MHDLSTVLRYPLEFGTFIVTQTSGALPIRHASDGFQVQVCLDEACKGGLGAMARVPSQEEEHGLCTLKCCPSYS